MSLKRNNDTGADILIVDDTPANLRLLSQMLIDRGHAVRAVTSGARALASARMSVPELVLLDIKMPEMDGYEVCQRLKADASTRDVPVIFISALDELQDKVQAFSVGGVDYVTKPFQLEEVVARVETHLALRRLQKQLENANRKMVRELALAGEVQASFLPSKLPEISGWDLAITLQPARETSGDFYDIVPLPGEKLGILIADVVDKGVGAALYMVLTWALMRTYAAEHPGQPELVLRATNRSLVLDTTADQFVSVFYGVLDPASGVLTYGNAGHCPPYLLRAQNGAVESLARTGMLLGIVEDGEWQQASVPLAPGDGLMLYTDGITEAVDAQGVFFGNNRLLDTLRANLGRSAGQIQDAVMAALRGFVGDTIQADDMALMVLLRSR
jgi:sigma-B regulation protein RsbU (phosphoserine phosphatase)